MDEEFIKGRAMQVRDIAARADPFTKKRLLALADRYDATIAKPSRATRLARTGPAPEESKSPENSSRQAGVLTTKP